MRDFSDSRLTEDTDTQMSLHSVITFTSYTLNLHLNLMISTSFECTRVVHNLLFATLREYVAYIHTGFS